MSAARSCARPEYGGRRNGGACRWAREDAGVARRDCGEKTGIKDLVERSWNGMSGFNEDCC